MAFLQTTWYNAADAAKLVKYFWHTEPDVVLSSMAHENIIGLLATLLHELKSSAETNHQHMYSLAGHFLILATYVPCTRRPSPPQKQLKAWP